MRASVTRRRVLEMGLLALLPAPLARAATPAAQTVGWNVLKTLKTDGAKAAGPPGPPSPAQQLNGKRVAIPGFMVPLEDDADRVSEFLLVPFAGACIHVPPPPPNQMVHVLMRSGGKVTVSFTDPIVVTGVLKVATVDSPYGDVSYDMTAETVGPYGG